MNSLRNIYRFMEFCLSESALTRCSFRLCFMFSQKYIYQNQRKNKRFINFLKALSVFVYSKNPFVKSLLKR